MKDIAIYGAGGFGRELACTIKCLNEKKTEWNFLGFFDDNKEKGYSLSGYGEILGGIKELNLYGKKINIVVAISDVNIRREIIHGITNNLVIFPNLIFDTKILDVSTFAMGHGNVICRQSWISCNVELGNFNFLNGNVNLGHDVRIGNYNTFMPGVRVSGGAIINNYNFFGVNSVILQNVEIGNNIRLAAGSVLIRKTKNNNLYIGNPAKIFKY